MPSKVKCAFLLPVLLLGLVLLSSGCGSKGDEPPALKIGYVPFDSEIIDRRHAYQHLAQFLSERLATPVELVTMSAYDVAIEAMASRRIDLAFLGPRAYVIASERAGAEAILVSAEADGSPRHYRSLIIMHRDRAVSDLDALKAQSLNLHFAVVNEASASGYHIPEKALQAAGINLQDDFKQVSQVGAHALAIMGVINGDYDIAAVSDARLKTLAAAGKADSSQLSVVWTSQPIPVGPMAVHRDIAPEIKTAIQEIMSQLPETDPKDWNIIRTISTREDWRLAPASDALYDVYR